MTYQRAEDLCHRFQTQRYQISSGQICWQAMCCWKPREVAEEQVVVMTCRY